MFYEVILGLTVLVYFFWKLLLSSKQGSIKDDEYKVVQTVEEADKPVSQTNPAQCNDKLDLTVIESINLTQENKVQNESDNCDATDRKLTHKLKTVTKRQVSSPNAKKTEEIITPSALLKKQEEKAKEANSPKRESPPKERFNEFLEKTVLNDDKINSIIQNLSLDTSTRIKLPKLDEPPLLDLTITPIERNDTHAAAQTENKLNFTYELNNILKPNKEKFVEHKDTGETLENKSNIRNKLNDIFKPNGDAKIKHRHTIAIPDDISEQFESVLKYNESLPDDGIDSLFDEIAGKQQRPEEPTLIVQRIQKGPGFPAALNFGSVIGELKNKTKNGGLKPVFKKFEADTVDNAAVRILHFKLKLLC